jgi:hypothetical protein
MKKYLFVLWFCFYVSMAIAGEKAPPEVRESAVKHLNKIMKNIFYDEDKANYGFAASDKIEDVVAGEPIAIYRFTSNLIKDLKDNKKPITNVNDLKSWTVPVNVHGVSKFFFLIVNVDGKWQPAHFWADGNARAIQLLLTIYPIDKIEIFMDVPERDYFFSLPYESENNLTLIKVDDLMNLRSNTGKTEVMEATGPISDAVSTIDRVIQKQEKRVKGWKRKENK